MAAGFQIINEGGHYQVSETYMSFGLLAKGTVSMTLDAAYTASPVRTGSLTIAATNPICAIGTSSAYVSVFRTSYSGGSWTFYFRCASTVNFNLNYWLFDNSNAVMSTIVDNSGLQVFRSDGTTAFHSSMKPLKIVDVTTVAITQSNTVASSIPTYEGVYVSSKTLTAGKTYATVSGSIASGSETLNVGFTKYGTPPSSGGIGPANHWNDINYYDSASKITSNVIQVGFYPFSKTYDYGNGVVDLQFAFGAIQFWTLDVTNY